MANKSTAGVYAAEAPEKIKIIVPIPPSVNACYCNRKTAQGGQRGRALTEIAKNWKLIAGYAAKGVAREKHLPILPKGEKFVIEIYAYWPDARRHDMNNTHKLLCDAWEGILYEDDCCVLARDMDFCVDRKNPRLECFIYAKPKEERHADLQ